jgi:general secretion pathway protein D
MQCIKKVIVFCSILPVLAGCAGGLASYNKAQKLEQKGKLDEAVLKYAEAAAANPDIAEYRVRFLTASNKAAKAHLKKGEEYLSANKFEDAIREFQTANSMDPSLARAGQMIEQATKLKNMVMFLRDGEEFEKDRKLREALGSFKKALDIDPDNIEAKEAVARLLKIRKTKLEGYELNLKSTKPITLKFKDAKIKEVFNILTQLSGINFVFDEAVKDQGVSIFLENATFQQALEILTGINKLQGKVLNESTMIIYPDTAEKKKQYEELRVETFLLNKLDAKKAVNLIRTMMPTKKIYVNEDTNALVIRDTPEAIDVARKILEANDIPDAEVVLDVEVVEISKDKMDNFGFALSQYAISFAAAQNGSSSFLSDTLVPPTTSTTTGTSTSTSGATVNNLLNFMTARGFSGFMTVPNATFNFAKTLTNGETLANPKIRVKSREKSKFNVGTRVPITTTSSPVGGGISVNVQYVDVGVKVNAEPTVQMNNEISIKLSLEVSTIVGQQTVGGTTAPTTVVTIGTRNLDTVLSLKDGETSIIGGLIQNTTSSNKQKISFLADIPIVGSLLSNTDNTGSKDELLLSITPHIVRGITLPDSDVAAFWSGKEDEPSTTNPYVSFVQEPEITAAQPSTQAFPSGATSPVVPAVPAAPVNRAIPAVPVAPANQAAHKEESHEEQPKTALNINAPATAKLNERFSVDVVSAGVSNLYSAPFIFSYDPDILDFDGASEGHLLKSDGKLTSFLAINGSNNRQITVILSRVGNVGGVSGSGTLVSLTFKAKKQGTAKLGLSAVHFTDPSGRLLDVTPSKTLVEVK